jgi:hypothetical protein
MSAAVLSAPVPATAPVRAVIPQLAVGEARRLLRHPLMLLALGFWVFTTAMSFLQDIKVVQAFEMVTSTLSFFPGIPAVLVAHMVVTRDRRAGTTDLLTATPARREERVWAMGLASTAPAALTLLLNVGLYAALRATGVFEQVPTVWHVVQAPLTVLGACLLGVMVAVWAPNLIAPVVTMVALVAAHLAISERSPAMLFGTAIFWVDWGPFDGSVWVGLHPGSAAWHQLYLVGLCGMALAGAVVRVAERRTVPVVLGILSVGVALLGGLAQLP